MKFNFDIKLNYQIDESLFDIMDKIKRLLSNFIISNHPNKIVIYATKDEVEGLYLELESYMKKNLFNRIKDENFKFVFVKDTDIIKISNAIKQNKKYSFKIESN